MLAALGLDKTEASGVRCAILTGGALAFLIMARRYDFDLSAMGLDFLLYLHATVEAWATSD
jgi:hypothetical protein